MWSYQRPSFRVPEAHLAGRPERVEARADGRRAREPEPACPVHMRSERPCRRGRARRTCRGPGSRPCAPCREACVCAKTRRPRSRASAARQLVSSSSDRVVDVHVADPEAAQPRPAPATTAGGRPPCPRLDVERDAQPRLAGLGGDGAQARVLDRARAPPGDDHRVDPRRGDLAHLRPHERGDPPTSTARARDSTSSRSRRRLVLALPPVQPLAVEARRAVPRVVEDRDLRRGSAARSRAAPARARPRERRRQAPLYRPPTARNRADPTRPAGVRGGERLAGLVALSSAALRRQRFESVGPSS